MRSYALLSTWLTMAVSGLALWIVSELLADHLSGYWPRMSIFAGIMFIISLGGYILTQWLKHIGKLTPYPHFRYHSILDTLLCFSWPVSSLMVIANQTIFATEEKTLLIDIISIFSVFTLLGIGLALANKRQRL